MMNKNRASFLIVVFLLLTFRAYNQSQNPNVISNFVPVSPTAFQFLKYTEMPISEYTGLANISVPLYEINEDGVNVPIALTYHPIGNRVSQEASWVGLSWDMQFGSIVQMINDEDDFGTQPTPTKILPDYYSNPLVSEFPHRYQWPFSIIGGGWSSPLPINTPQAEYGRKITTSYYIPINGDYETKRDDFFTYQYIDSEPDIFKANFLGHSLNYKLDWKTNSIVVLNKKGYKIIKTSDTWKIIVPSGDEFYFEEKSVVESNSATSGSVLSPLPSGTVYTPSSIIWMLTKIITKNKKKIVFNYSRTGQFESFPNYSEKYQKPTFISTRNPCGLNSCTFSGWSLNGIHSISGVGSTYSLSKESYTYLSSIVFPKGTINFITSLREDVIGAQKLDKIDIKADNLIKSFNLNYSYFDSKNIGGNGFTLNNASYYKNALYLRLKLLSLQENDGVTHTFKYNETLLPKKNSFAQDFWGFYNGQLSNVSLIANPTRLKIIGIPDNSNNNSANLAYSKASILEEIQYPTGGKVILDYSLNEFNNYWVPDFDNINNTISKGNGLRINSIRFKENDQTQSKKTIYTYSGGKSIQPISMYRNYEITSISISPQNASHVTATNYKIDEINATGFFSSSIFSSINGVGYDKVTKEEVNYQEQSLGKIETYFHNQQDKVGFITNVQMNAVLPAVKNKDLPENGSIKSISYFDRQNNLLKKIEYNYEVICSAIFYGVRVAPYTTYWYQEDFNHYVPLSQNLINYYPIFDIETILKKTTEGDIVNNNTLTTSTAYTHDGIHQISSSVKTTPTSTESTFFDYPYSISPQQPFHVALAQRNMLSVVGVRKEKTVSTHPDDFIQTYELSKEYTQLGDRVLESKVTIREQSANSSDTKEIFYDYDLASGNLLKSTEDGVATGLIWDYKDNYAVAVVKGDYSSIAYSSFEADGKGSWTYNGISVSEMTAPTGKKIYSLNNGQITKTGLIPSNTYILSYWSNSSSVAVRISNSISFKTGQSINGWKYYEHEIVSANGNVVIDGYGNIDELRLCDKTAQMKTFTYEPLVGITSQCEVNNLISYYHYDVFGRLTGIKDRNGNIIKGYEYNLKGVPPNYNVFSNPRLEVVFTKNDCNTGFLGSNVSYVVPERKYEGITQSAADQLAVNEVQKYGQAYANTQGRCDPIVYYNAAKSVIFIKNNCGALAGSAVTYTVLAAWHSSIISQADADAKAQTEINNNGQNYANQNGQCSGFYNVQKSGTFVRNNCTDIRSKGGTITYVVPARTIASAISQADADAKAQADVNANGQNYANANGLCTTPPYIFSSYVIGTTATLRCAPIDNCISSKTEVRNIYGQLIATYPGGCGVEHIINVPVQGTQYKYTIIFYSSDYPSGITSTEVIMPYN